MRRLDLFNTTSLPSIIPEAPDWMYNNAFSILLWIVKEIEENLMLIDPSERFFEREVTDLVPVKVIMPFLFF